MSAAGPRGDCRSQGKRTCSRLRRRDRSLGSCLQIVESCDRISLGPEAVLAARERAVGCRDHLGPIPLDGNLCAPRGYLERVPCTGRDPKVLARELLAVTLDDAVQTHVVLERVGPRQQVVVAVFEPEHEPPGTIRG